MSSDEILQKFEKVVEAYRKESEFYRTQVEILQQKQQEPTPLPETPSAQLELTSQDVYVAHRDPKQWAKIIDILNQNYNPK